MNIIRSKILYLLLLNILFVYSSLVAYNPESYVCSSHVKYIISTDNYNYNIKYTFKDQFNITRVFNLSYPIKLVNRNNGRFGIPSYVFSWENSSKSKIQWLAKRGFFKLEGTKLKPDHNAIIRFYRPYCKPIADEIYKSLKRLNKTSRKNKIDFAMKFVQDIPYGIPDTIVNGKLNNGFMVPSEILVKGYGDCDSKAVLFICILSYLINPADIIILNQSTHHTLTAIKEIPEYGQVYIEVDKSKYVLAETAGPGRFMFGDDGNKFNSKSAYKIEKIISP